MSAAGPASIHVAPGRSLGALVWAAAEQHAARLALDAAGKRWTYEELRARAARIATLVEQEVAAETPRLCAVLASRAADDYAGVLGALFAGAGYVPLNVKFPAARNVRILAASGCRCLVTSASAGEPLHEILGAAPNPLLVIAPDLEDPSAWQARHPRHRFVGSEIVAAAAPRERPAPVDEDGLAYLMFTSGTTGDPKGVMVTHANVLHHLDVCWARYGISETDACSQTFDLTFDLSVFDMFACWGRGASLHVVPAKQQLAPGGFVVEHALTVWYSVPSVAMMLRGLRMLKPGAFASLRLSLFCGERLPQVVAEAWQAAAPNSRIENVYGPTEATIACTYYRWDAERSPGQCVDGVVPIGVPFDGLAAAVVDEKLGLVPAGERGELLVRGPQVTPGYWRDPGRTGERFVAVPWDGGPQNRWYRTGDLAYFDAAGDLIHCGRSDEQVKLRGYRIELGEIEHALREASGADAVAVVGWPVTDVGISGLVGFVAAPALELQLVTAELRRRLPDYMVPNQLVRVDQMPLNANGKIDKRALRASLEETHAQPK